MIEQGTVNRELTNDSLAELIDTWEKEAARLGRLAFGARQELLARLIDDGATVLDTEHWAGKVKPGQITHRVEDVERLWQRLAVFLSTKDLEGAFIQPPTPVIRVDHTAMNNLHKRGGDISRIIDEERVSIRGDSTLELERKAGVQA